MPAMIILTFIAMAFLILLYGVIPTVAIRTAGFRILKRVPRRKGIALTFDDGPNPLYTPQLLDLLKQYGIRAVFFVVGEKAEMHPDIIKRMHEEGHDIGIHHYIHKSSWRMGPAELKDQLKKTDAVIEQITGQPARYYRPPWGRFNLFTLRLSRQYKIVMWSHIFEDWKIRSCQETLLGRLHQVDEDGAIILLHDDGENPGADTEAPAFMLEALEIYLRESVEKGKQFIPLNE